MCSLPPRPSRLGALTSLPLLTLLLTASAAVTVAVSSDGFDGVVLGNSTLQSSRGAGVLLCLNISSEFSPPSPSHTTPDFAADNGQGLAFAQLSCAFSHPSGEWVTPSNATQVCCNVTQGGVYYPAARTATRRQAPLVPPPAAESAQGQTASGDGSIVSLVVVVVTTFLFVVIVVGVVVTWIMRLRRKRAARLSQHNVNDQLRATLATPQTT